MPFDPIDPIPLTKPMLGNTWQRDPAVSFANTGLSESIQVRPSTNPNFPATYADTIYATMEARWADGQRAVLRPWFNLDWGDQPRVFNSPSDRTDVNAWPQVHPPFEDTTIPPYLSTWWFDFNEQLASKAVMPDYCMLDNEVRRTFYYFADAAQREAYFTSVTTDPGTYPFDPNPYFGQDIWTYGSTIVDQFISEWEQWSYVDHNNVLTSLHLDLRLFDQFSISNYANVIGTGSYGEVNGRPNRLPYARSQIADVSAPICYWNKRDLALFQPEPEYVTTREIANRMRWKNFIFRINSVRDAANANAYNEVHPWIQSPGWAWNGGEGWATATQLPFELILWRRMNRHLEEMGIHTYNVWNPIPSTPGTNDPFSATTHLFMANHFAGRRVRGSITRGLPLLDYTVDSITTNGYTTTYEELFEPATVYYRQANLDIVPYSVGSGTESDPLLINNDEELTALTAAFAAELGYTPTTEDVSSVAITAADAGYQQTPDHAVNWTPFYDIAVSGRPATGIVVWSETADCEVYTDNLGSPSAPLKVVAGAEPTQLLDMGGGIRKAWVRGGGTAEFSWNTNIR